MQNLHDNNEEESTFDKWKTPVIAALVGAAGLKAGLDVRKVRGLGTKWLSTVQGALPKHVGPGGITEGVLRAQNYARGGRELIRAKVLGIPIPYVGNRLLQGIATGPSSWPAFIKRPFEHARDKWKGWAHTPRERFLAGQSLYHQQVANNGLHDHYLKYFSKHLNDQDLDNYAMFGDGWSGLRQSTRDLLSQPDRSISNVLMQLHKSDPNDAKALRELLKQNSKKFGGFGPGDGGIAQKYVQDSEIPLSILETGGNLAGIGGLSTAGYLGLRNINDAVKEAAAVNEDSNSLRELLATALGAGSAVSGASELRNPLRVGFSWSERAKHGDGHKNPGKAIQAIVQELRDNDPRFKDIETRDMTRTLHNGVRTDQFLGRKLDALFDTGMGSASQWDWTGEDHPSPNRQIPGLDNQNFDLHVKRPRVRAGGYVGYMTDVGKLGDPANGYRHSIRGPLRALLAMAGVKDNYITWGPKDILQHRSEGQMSSLRPFMNFNHVGNDGMPTLTPKAIETVDWAKRVGRDGVFAEAMNSDAISPEHKAMLQEAQAKGKKVVAFTGSGRGDYVTTRVRDFMRAARRAGTLDDYLILAPSGESGAMEPANRWLAKQKNVMVTGRLPQKLYVGLPAIADLHNASTGTSAAFEALNSDSNLAVTQDWGKMKDREQRNALGRNYLRTRDEFLPQLRHANPNEWERKWREERSNVLGNSTKRRSSYWGLGMRDAWEKLTGGVYLDDWNVGNRDYMYRQPGVQAVQTGDDMLKAVGNLASRESLKDRGSFQQLHSGIGRENLKGTIANLLQRAKVIKNVRGGAKLAGGLGLAAAGILPQAIPLGQGVADRAAPIADKARGALSNVLSSITSGAPDKPTTPVPAALSYLFSDKKS
jgi:hypothetical protein